MTTKGNGTGTDLALRIASENGFSTTQLELIRGTAAKDCSSEEIAQLLIMARRTGLDPLARQIYMIKRWNNQAKREVATPQTGIDGYRLIADRTERYAPGREPTFSYDDQGGLWSATSYVKKLVGGTWHEVAATAVWAEYAQTKRNGDLTETWAKMPHVMLAKCAEALALRRAFPAELSGVYTSEEMGQADNEDVIDVQPVIVEPAATPTKATASAAAVSLYAPAPEIPAFDLTPEQQEAVSQARALIQERVDTAEADVRWTKPASVKQVASLKKLLNSIGFEATDEQLASIVAVVWRSLTIQEPLKASEFDGIYIFLKTRSDLVDVIWPAPTGEVELVG